MKELEKKLLAILKDYTGNEESASECLTELCVELQEHDNNTVTDLICSK